MNTSPVSYHDDEFRIALDSTSPHRVVPDTGSAEAVLDIGCGAGQTPVTLGHHKRRVGVDVDIEALRFGLHRTTTEGIRVAAAQGEHPPFAERTFDLVYSRVAPPYTDIPAALTDMPRVR